MRVMDRGRPERGENVNRSGLQLPHLLNGGDNSSITSIKFNTHFEQCLAHRVHLPDGDLSWLFLLFVTGNYVFIITLSRLKMTKEVLTILLLVCFQVNGFSKIIGSAKPNFTSEECKIY